MAFLEWRRFSFFDVHKNVDNNKIAECLQDTKVSVSTSGNNHVILCDITGWAHLISRSWEITSFKAYELTVTLAQQYQHDTYLVTIGEDEPGTNPMIKVWDWARVDRHGNPSCVRTCRAVPSHMRPTPATALAAHDNKNLMAVGYQDGSVSLFRGDVTRQRSGKMKTLQDTGTGQITTLAFKGADKLFIVSRTSVMVYWLSSDRCITLDAMGAAPSCAVLADNHNLMLAAKLAIYCYTTEGRGPCYALEGEKIRLDWFRSYLVITTNETPIYSDAPTTSSSTAIQKSHHITILDIQNKFIVFSKTFDELDAVITEWGSFYILTKSKELIYLDEKDLQSKLSLLYKKNLYDVAIRIASSQHYDAEGLLEICKQYGDHLYAKGDLKGAIDQYIKTIGWLETSYVIPKYLESRQLEPLIVYLEELHKRGYATEDHTTLLLTCYVKIDQHDQQGKLKEFINSNDKAIDFDVDVAIKVVRQVSPEDALTLAANHKHHSWYLKIMLEDQKDYQKALDYIAELDFENADFYMKKYGHTLIQYAPKESTDLVKLLCTDYKARSEPLVSESSLTGAARLPGDRASPDQYIHLFLNNSQQLIDFLDYMVENSEEKCSKLVYNALLEHYIHVWAKSDEAKKGEFEEKVMKVLRDSEANYDKDQMLVICQMLAFKPGILHLYEENKLWRAQIRAHLRSNNVEAALSVCLRRGGKLWLELLWHRPPPTTLATLLTHIAREKLLSPLLVVDSLASTPNYTLGDVRQYLTTILKAEEEVITRESELALKYRSESERMKEVTRALQSEPCVFQSSRCAACSRALDLPSMHLMCQHSFHLHCFQSYSEREGSCPVCGRERAPPGAAPPPERLHSRLSTHTDSYAVVSEYFGRGLFNKITLVAEGGTDDAAVPAPPPPAPVAAPAPAPAPAPLSYGPGAEAKLRLQEGQSRQVFVASSAKQIAPKGTSVIPVPEGRMRVLEQQKYSSSLEANMSKLPEPIHAKTTPIPAQKIEVRSQGNSPKISNAISNQAGANPFDETYDEAKNPFADDDEVNNPTNPFGEDDDYDKNLNPFE